ncbi:MAG: formate dehydrogenase accessory sulfurtransferase FdhD [Chitinophagales bacterium]|nr:formate dehydrogenase accessory sulfurtransferase FdhD [Bacteroidota bacterium]MCB9042781.1 formate dehydrogenase accessory sulfurtransferase FdhD [Chitinophagales bacterium]
MNTELLTSLMHLPVKKVNGFSCRSNTDALAVEEPLEICIEYGDAADRTTKNISVTMRTPGKDEDLAVGFLFTENIISDYSNILTVKPTKNNVIQVSLQENFTPKLSQADRNFYTTSSCGLCGKGSIDAITTVSSFKNIDKVEFSVSVETLYQLPRTLRAAQNNFENTGGIHAAGLFSTQGELLLLREDVGRHNALDKLIGAALSQNWLPLNRHILLLSGRASFELIQKAAMAGVAFVAAIGAPSSLAVELATESDITLIGFLKENRFNIYNQTRNIKITGINEN